MELRQIIEDSLQGIKAPAVQVIRDRELESTVYAVASGLELCTTYVSKDKKFIGTMPITNAAGFIGKLIQAGFETGLEERVKTLNRIKIGMHCLVTLEKAGKIRFLRGSNKVKTPKGAWGDSTVAKKYSVTIEEVHRRIKSKAQKWSGWEMQKANRDKYYIDIQDQEFLNEVMQYLGGETYTPKIYSEILVDELPGNWGHQYHTEGGDMVRNCLQESKDFNTWENTPLLYKVINKHQGNKYEVNTQLMTIAQELQEGFYKDVDRSDYPEGEKGSQDYAKACESIKSKRAEYTAILKRANRASKGDFFSTWNFLDNRVGRLYSSASFLNYGGAKLSKNLHRFKHRIPVGASGIFNLKVHLANSIGYDKATRNERAAFVDRNIDFLYEIAKNPVANKDWWIDTDDCWGTISSILELVRIDGNEDETSGFICAWDASCSGLQILSMLSRDKVSGALCNLVPSDTRGDFYLTIADAVWASFGRNDQGDFWKKHYNKRRKLVKRICMTVWYSAGISTCADAHYDDFIGKIPGLTEELSLFLTTIVHKTCFKTLKGPGQLMKLFQRIGLDSFDNREDLMLTTPVTRALWQQNARKPKSEEVEFKWTSSNTSSGESAKRRLRLVVNTIRYHQLDVKKCISATSPSIIHMLDSQLVAWMLLHFPGRVAMIHDSMGFRLGEAEEGFHYCRKAMVEVFSDDLLSQILKEVDSLEYLTDGFVMGKTHYQIEMGDLEISKIPETEWSFS